MTATVTATFVFTDLVDSTATAARLGPERAEELRQAHFRLLRGAIDSSGGTLVKNLGDGLMVVYSSPSRALAGAVGMQQAIEHHNRSGGEPLGVRIGISTGEAVEEDGDYFGDAVVVAARLCAAAGPGQILTSQVVRLLVGSHATQSFADVGPLTLKGIPEAVDTVEVRWEPASMAGSVPLPPRLVAAARDSLFGFFGRAGEVEVIEQLRKRAHADRTCQVAFVAGEAGIGKTSLVARTARAAHDDGAVVVLGHADEGVGIAHQPWIEALGTLVRDGDPDWIEALRPVSRGSLARLVPELGRSSDWVGDPDSERLLLWEGVVELLRIASEVAPVVVVLDDLHWADTASLQLLRHLVRSAADLDVVVLCTYRDTDLGRGDPLANLLVDLGREDSTTRLSLDGLSDDAIVDLVAAAAGHDLDDEGLGLAHTVRRETNGNPFFATELLRHLGETGGIVLGDDGRWTLAASLDSLGLPNSVREVVGRRVERLGDHALHVLRLAAVLGRDFDLAVLAELADVGEGELLDLMDAAIAAAVVVETDVPARFRFAHALVQHTLYDELGATRRQRAHRRAAELLEQSSAADEVPTINDIARHWMEASTSVDLNTTLRYVQRAGDAARDALAPDDAIRWYEQALELLAQRGTGDERVRAELLAALGAVQRQAGRPEFRDTLFEAAAVAERLGADDLLEQVTLKFGGFLSLTGDDQLGRLAATALDRAGPEPSATRARLLVVRMSAYDASLQWRERTALAREALEVARHVGDDAVVLEAILGTVHALPSPDELDEGLENYERAVVVADRIGDPVLRAEARMHQLLGCFLRSDPDGADEVLAETKDLVDDVGLPMATWRYLLGRAARLLVAGRLDDAEAVAEEARDLGVAAGIPEAIGTHGGTVFVIRTYQGRLGEIADFFIEVARDNPSIAVLRYSVIAMLAHLGRLDEARERLEVEAAAGFDVPFDATWLSAVHDLLDAAAMTRDVGSGQALVELVAPYAHQVVANAAVVHGSAARPLARVATMLGDHERAEEWFVLAHTMNERLRAPYAIAHTELDRAELCLARRSEGDLERARDLVDAAAAAAERHGYAALAARAARLRESAVDG